ncbi:hypothetical protein ACPFUC_003669 [Vibrio cholerae]
MASKEKELNKQGALRLVFFKEKTHEELGKLAMTSITLCITLILLLAATLTQLVDRICVPIIFRHRFTRTIYMLTAAVFVPIHELSHAIGCLIFRHKINKIVLFSPNTKTGQLGYVEHSWNTRSLYQNIGCFFIAVFPLITASIAVYSMLPEKNIEITTTSNFNSNVIVLVADVVSKGYSVAVNALNINNNINGWVTVFVVLLCYHCTPSRSDFINAFTGGLVFILVMLGMNFINIETALLHHWLMSISQIMAVMISASFLGIAFCLMLTICAILISYRTDFHGK